MIKAESTFSSYSVDDLAKARDFYVNVLGLDVTEDKDMGILRVALPHAAEAIIYPKPDHAAANFTVLNFVVADIDQAVDELSKQGVTFERYEGFNQDERGIVRGDAEPEMAWFKDPAGNILAVLTAE